MWREFELNQKQSIFMEIIFTIIILIAINYLFLIIAEGLLLIVSLLIFIHIIIIRILIFYSKNYYKIDDLDEEVICNFNKKNLKIILIGFIIMFFLLMIPYLISFSTYNSDQSELELKMLVDEIIEGLDDNESKTLAILRWFDRGFNKEENMSNIYHRFRQDDIMLLLYFKLPPQSFIYSKYPYFGVRLSHETDNWANWIFHTRLGMCDEFGNLFTAMCSYANLDVRTVFCKGEDHIWNEVKINGTWIIIDATAVNLPCFNGYNRSRDFMENKVKGDLIANGKCVDEGNVSYIYTTYPDIRDYKEDITERYTDLINISITVLDEDSQPLNDVKVKLFSYNRLKRWDTTLSSDTNESGICFFNIGGGDYSFEASFNGLSSKFRDSFSEDILNHSITLTMK